MSDNAPRVAGVRFRNAGKIFYFHASGMRLETGEYVVVESVRGPEVAKVVIAPDQVVVNELGREELRPILRLATEDDIERADSLKQRAEALLIEARALAQDARFPARIDDGEFTLDGRRLTLSFTSEDRIDYRDFVRRVSDRFKVKVDMRQLGSRDRAKLAGGYGICGRELCCSSWLSTFPSISIRMAKEQELPLNPQKISGLCGRLLCCLSYEEEGYKEMRKTLPKIGQRCSTPTGEGKVISLNILRRSVTLWADGGRVEVPDRDLGTVVRWDVSSKAGDPPPSISRVDAIAQGLVEETEEDRMAAERRDAPPDWLDERPTAFEPGPGRGRLPGGGPRKNMPARPPRGEVPSGAAPAQGRQDRRPQRGNTQPGQAAPPQNRNQGPRPERDRRPQGPTSTEPSNLGQGRVFKRGADAPGDRPAERQPRPAPPREERQSAEGGSAAPGGNEQRTGRRRNRRGRGGNTPPTP